MFLELERNVHRSHTARPFPIWEIFFTSISPTPPLVNNESSSAQVIAATGNLWLWKMTLESYCSPLHSQLFLLKTISINIKSLYLVDNTLGPMRTEPTLLVHCHIHSVLAPKRQQEIFVGGWMNG